MTVAPRAPRLAFGDIEDVAAALRSDGGRLSAARRLVLEALFAADGPVSAEHIADGLGGRLSRLDVASVYRTLERLEALGAVRHVHLGHGPGLYALARDDREYLVCERCDRITSVDSARLSSVRAQIQRHFGYEVHFSHFPILGLCAQCVAQPPPEAHDRPLTSGRRGGHVSEHREHRHDEPHTHAHSHGDEQHSHPHTGHDHEHTGHDHEHSHGDRVHSHPHLHEQGLEGEHRHQH